MVIRTFGGNGPTAGNPDTDPIGTVRRAPNNHLIAIKMAAVTVDPYVWHVMDVEGPLGPQRATRIEHWPVAGSVPGLPASDNPITPHVVDGELPTHDDEQAVNQ